MSCTVGPFTSVILGQSCTVDQHSSVVLGQSCTAELFTPVIRSQFCPLGLASLPLHGVHLPRPTRAVDEVVAGGTDAREAADCVPTGLGGRTRVFAFVTLVDV